MLKTLKIVGLSLIMAGVLSVGGQGVLSVDAQAAEMDKPVAARQAVMKLRAFYLGTLGGMAKGKIAYDAKKAQSAADSLLGLSNLDGSAMWPPGSGNDKRGTKTRALPAIWSTYPAVAEKGKAQKMAEEAMAKVAGNGLAALQGAIGDVGKACGGCHKQFREKKK